MKREEEIHKRQEICSVRMKMRKGSRERYCKGKRERYIMLEEMCVSEVGGRVKERQTQRWNNWQTINESKRMKDKSEKAYVKL